ncbi:MAG: hypothetical protein OET44_13795 [Gammaproteobacteria bacterium]|nr:hypothetical protein [Gammaproteobacteria bacterium]
MSVGAHSTRRSPAGGHGRLRGLWRLGLALLTVAVVPVTAQDVIELEGISIIGNPELPKTITLVPWKRALPGDLAAQPEGSLLDEELTAIDPPVFRRELRYYEAGFAIE